MSYITEAINTLKATRWELFKARLFGKTVKGWDGDITVTLKFYKGHYYLIGVEKNEDI